MRLISFWYDRYWLNMPVPDVLKYKVHRSFKIPGATIFSIPHILAILMKICLRASLTVPAVPWFTKVNWLFNAKEAQPEIRPEAYISLKLQFEWNLQFSKFLYLNIFTYYILLRVIFTGFVLECCIHLFFFGYWEKLCHLLKHIFRDNLIG